MPARRTAKVLRGLGVIAWQQGDYAVARPELEASLALWQAITPVDEISLADAAHMLGHVFFDQRDYAAARVWFGDSLSRFQAANDTLNCTVLTGDLGMVAYHLGDYAAARERFEANLVEFRAQAADDALADTLNRLGELARLEGDYERAGELYMERRAIARRLQAVLATASALHKLGYVAQQRGQHQQARALLEESLGLQLEQGNKQGVAEGLAGLAGLAVATGAPERGARLFGAAQALLDAIGAPLAPADNQEWQRAAALARQALGGQAFEAAWTHGRALTLEQARAAGRHASD